MCDLFFSFLFLSCHTTHTITAERSLFLFLAQLTALEAALRCDDIPLATLLLEAGADPDATCAAGSGSILHAVCERTGRRTASRTENDGNGWGNGWGDRGVNPSSTPSVAGQGLGLTPTPPLPLSGLTRGSGGVGGGGDGGADGGDRAASSAGEGGNGWGDRGGSGGGGGVSGGGDGGAEGGTDGGDSGGGGESSRGEGSRGEGSRSDVGSGGEGIRLGGDGIRLGSDGIRLGGDGIRLGGDGIRLGGAEMEEEVAVRQAALLLGYGASPSASNSRGEAPVDIALFASNAPLLQLLLSHGGRCLLFCVLFLLHFV